MKSTGVPTAETRFFKSTRSTRQSIPLASKSVHVNPGEGRPFCFRFASFGKACIRNARCAGMDFLQLTLLGLLKDSTVCQLAEWCLRNVYPVVTSFSLYFETKKVQNSGAGAKTRV